MFALPDNFPYKILIVCFMVTVICLAFDIAYANPLNHILHGEINTRNIKPIIKTLHYAKQKDTVTIDLNSRGGDIYSALELIKAMHESKVGAVVVYIHQYAFGAAALIALEADNIILDPNAQLDFAIVNDDFSGTEVLKRTIIQGHRSHSIWNIPYKGMYTIDEGWSTLAQV